MGDKRIDWNAIRAEYIAGGTSYRKLCSKYGVTLNMVQRRGKDENWQALKEEASNRSNTEAIQRTAEAAADNAAIAQRIRTKLLLRLEREIDSMPDTVGSDSHQSTSQRIRGENGNYTIKDAYRAYKLKDLTAAWKDLTGDLSIEDDTEDIDATRAEVYGDADA